MKVRYAVTFEFELQAPITHRGTVTATGMPTCFARAARDAAKAHPGLRWSSMVCVLLERLDVAVIDGHLPGMQPTAGARSGDPLERGIDALLESGVC